MPRLSVVCPICDAPSTLLCCFDAIAVAAHTTRCALLPCQANPQPRLFWRSTAAQISACAQIRQQARLEVYFPNASYDWEGYCPKSLLQSIEPAIITTIMASSFDIDAIRGYLLKQGYKVEYSRLVNAFKERLCDPDPNVQGKIRVQFKDFVNRLATVSVEEVNGRVAKFIILRPEFRPPETTEPEPETAEAAAAAAATAAATTTTTTTTTTIATPALPATPTARTKTKTVKATKSKHNQDDGQAKLAPETPNHQPQIINRDYHFVKPKLPPKQSSDNRWSSIVRSVSNVSSVLGPLTTNHRLNNNQNHNQHEQPVVAPTPPPRRRPSTVSTRSRSSIREDEIDSLHSSAPLHRKWAVKACNCNYIGLLNLLRRDPRLAGYKDIVNGYTALHWAAKFGNLDVIKLIAGTHGLSADTKSSAGYTPLHVAYMFNRIEAADLLLKIYKANPDIRDHSGRRPIQYWTQQ